MLLLRSPAGLSVAVVGEEALPSYKAAVAIVSRPRALFRGDDTADVDGVVEEEWLLDSANCDD